MASRMLSDLREDVHHAAVQFEMKCESAGIDVLITCTWRSPKEQDELYAIGRTKPGRKVTNARAGESLHNRIHPNGDPASQAFDFVPLRNGKAVWSTFGNGIDEDPSDDDKDDLELWQRCGEIAESCGLEWAGRWKNFREYPHCQIA